MIFWKIILLLLSAVLLHSLPLHTADNNRYNARVIQYQRSGFFPRTERRLHRRHPYPPPPLSSGPSPPPPGLRSIPPSGPPMPPASFMRGIAPVESYLRNNGEARTHNAAIYEVPSNRHYNDPQGKRALDIRLRSMVEKYFNNDGSLKGSLRPRPSPTMPGIPSRNGIRIMKERVATNYNPVLNHFLNVGMSEFHEQPVQTTKIDPNEIRPSLPKQTTPIVLQRRKKIPQKPVKSYPLGLQFLNNLNRRTVGRTGAQRLTRNQISNPVFNSIKRSLSNEDPREPPTTERLSTSTTSSTTSTTTTQATTTTSAYETSETKDNRESIVPPTTTVVPVESTPESEMSFGFNDPFAGLDAESLWNDMSGLGFGGAGLSDIAQAGESGMQHEHSTHVGGAHSHEPMPHLHGDHVSHGNAHNHDASAQHLPHSFHHDHAEVQPRIDVNTHQHASNDTSLHDHMHEHHSAASTSHVHASSHNLPNDIAQSLDKMFAGRFNQHQTLEEQPLKHLHRQEEIIPVNPDLSVAVTPETIYANTTLHVKPITKRGIGDGRISGMTNRRKFENLMNFRTRNTTATARQSTRPMWYYMTTPQSIESQLNRRRMTEYLSMKMRTPKTLTTQAPKPTTPQPTSLPQVSQKELVHLRGIHIMFSDGKQDTGDTIPTIHLTASVSDKKKTNMSTVAKTGLTTSLPTVSPSRGSQQVPKTGDEVFDKIVGTAVIRNGHLYLIVYPFGPNKSLKVNINGNVSKLPLPHNKPVSYSDKLSPAPLTPTTAAPRAPTEPLVHDLPVALPHVAPESLTSEYQPPGKVTRTEVMPEPSPSTNTERTSHAMHHHHQHVHHHPAAPLALRQTADYPVNIEKLIASPPRFMSPWKNLNLSSVFPFPKKNFSASASNTEEDSEVDVVTFIAQATDPFYKIRTIMESLANTSLFNDTVNTEMLTGKTSMNNMKREAKFNFELTLQKQGMSSVQTNRQSTTQIDNNSEEVLYETSTQQMHHVKSNINTLQPLVKPKNMHTIGLQQMQPRGVVKQVDNVFRVTSPATLMDEYLKEGPSIRVAATSKVIESKNIEHPTSLVEQTPATTQQSDSSVKLPSARIIGKVSSTTQHFEKFKHVTIPPTITESSINTGTTSPSTPISSLLSTGNSYLSTSNKPDSSTVLITTADTSFTPLPSSPTTPTHTTTPSSLAPRTSTPSTAPDSIGYTVLSETTFNRNTTVARKLPQPINAKVTAPRVLTPQIPHGSNIQPVANSGQRLYRGQAEQVMSLSDILNDIRKIQLHNMQRFNIQNNNYNNLILKEASRQNNLRTPMVVEGPVFQETSTRRFANRGRPAMRPMTPSTIQSRLLEQSQNAINDALDAMLVLTVDDILADHTTLHGALVMSQNQKNGDQSSSNR